MGMNQSELLHMLKNGRREEVAEYVREFERQNYTDNFVSFMDQMIREHRISRKQVALRSGLSQDYTYKLLRGDKHTDERDYILAMCMAIGMTLAQTQHALSCYGMPLLSDRDVRGHLIILALEDGMEMDALDDVLEKAGLPAIRTSPDMPSASITSTEQVQKAEVRQKGKFEEIDSFVHAEHNGGNSPFDYDYQGWIRVEDEAGNRYQVEAIFSDEVNSFIVFTEEQRRHAEELMKKAAEKEQAFWEAHEEELKETGGEINFMDQPELFSQLMEIRAQAGVRTCWNAMIPLKMQPARRFSAFSWR